MSYRITGLDPAPYKPLYGLCDDALAKRGVVRMEVTAKPSFPCRISLTDRDLGERVLLLNHTSLDVAGPYRASHAIFVIEGAEEPAGARHPHSVAARFRRAGDDGGCSPGAAGRGG